MEPINYLSQVADPFAQATQGLRLGAGMVELQQKQAAAEQQKLATQQYNQALLRLQSPKATAADFENMIMISGKDQAANLKTVMESRNLRQNQAVLNQVSPIAFALKTGNVEQGITLLNQQAEAARNSGDTQEATYLTQMAEQAKSQPENVGNLFASKMTLIPGGKDALDNLLKLTQERRVEAEAPSKLSEQVAKASKALTAAEVAVATAPDDIARAKALREFEQAKATKETVDARYAEKTVLADLKKKAADLGLTSAQTGAALAQTKKLGVESQKAALELEALKASGGLDPAKAFEQEEKLRKEYQVRSKVYNELQTTYKNIESSSLAKSGPGDVALITGFMKMLDPGSVVRETEFATARDTAGLYERLKNSLAKAESGEFLQNSQRQEFTNLAKKYLDSANKKAGEDKKALGVVVKNYRLNPENVFGPETAAEPPPELPTSVTVGGKTYTRPQNFTDEQWSAYKQSVGAK